MKPYQPAGYWAFLNFPTREYVADKGEDLYRRGLYTYWQRTFLHPSLLAFDAPSREECTVERPRSNTPLQALVLLNDPTYVEAARVFAARMIREGGHGRRGAARLRLPPGARAAAAAGGGRSPAARCWQKHRQQYRGRPDRGRRRCSRVGDAPAPADVDPAELAAWTSVARVILNLHETITRN